MPRRSRVPLSRRRARRLTAAAAARRGRDRPRARRRPRADASRTGPRSRSATRPGSPATRELLRLGARTGGGYAGNRARRVFASAERRAELDTEHELRTAAQVGEALGNMKGALMKLGQMASYLAPGLPEPVRDALAQLQQDAPPMSPELAAGVVEQELGRPPERGVRRVGPGADRGGVDRPGAPGDDARRAGGRGEGPVPRRGRGDPVRHDRGIGGPARASRSSTPGFEPGPLIAELRDRISEELDYRLEAAQQQAFADYFADHPFIHVPGVVPELSTTRVLVTELAEGVRFAEVLRVAAGRARPRGRDDLPLRLHRPLPAPPLQRRSRTPGTTSSCPAAGSRSSTSGCARCSPRRRSPSSRRSSTRTCSTPTRRRFRAAMEGAGLPRRRRAGERRRGARRSSGSSTSSSQTTRR